MKLAFHTNGCWPSGLDEAMRRLAAIGYAGIEIAPHPATLPPLAWTTEEARRLRGAADEIGLMITNLDLGHALLLSDTPHEPSFMAPYAGQRDQRVELVRRGIAFAAELGAPMVSLPSGPLAPNMPRNLAMEHLIDGIDACLGMAADHDISLAIEPVPGHLIGSYAAYIELAQIFAGDHFGLCYDLAHAHSGFEDIASVIADASDLLHLHFSDAAGREPEHLVPGEGELDLIAMLRRLEGRRYDGFVSVELADTLESDEAAAQIAFSRLMNDAVPAASDGSIFAQ